MGERLEKDVDAILKATTEQQPKWHRATETGGISPHDALPLLIALFGAMRDAVLFLAREIEDPPRSNDL
jgi:hypothetical protein